MDIILFWVNCKSPPPTIGCKCDPPPNWQICQIDDLDDRSHSYVLAFFCGVVMGEGLQIYVQYLYPCVVVVGEGLQIYVQNLYPERVCRSMFNIYIRVGL